MMTFEEPEGFNFALRACGQQDASEIIRNVMLIMYKEAYQAGSASRDNEVEILTTAIQRALDDEESGKGWGPDVTVCGYLSDALKAVRSR